MFITSEDYWIVADTSLRFSVLEWVRVSDDEYSKVTALNNSQKCVMILKELHIIFKRGVCNV